MANQRVERVQGLRRSSGAQPHRNKKRYRRADSKREHTNQTREH